jgi:UDP-N-acetylmuramoyl-tripeptide--D-alanyl-D-alanine ligase
MKCKFYQVGHHGFNMIFWKYTMQKKISTDTRDIEIGDHYLALSGEKFDGHNFIAEALEKGAAMIYSSKDFKTLIEDINQQIITENNKANDLNTKSEDQQKKISKLEASKNILSENQNKLIIVKNTLEEYQRLATEYRDTVNPLVIAITGSNGKTTTKEMLAAVLKDLFKIHYSDANFNNEIGVPKTILAMPEDTEILILEMGMRGLGQIDLLSKIAKPNICVITCIGSAHIELLGSKENIKKAKMEIINYIQDYKFSDFTSSNSSGKNPSEKFLNLSKQKIQPASFIIDENLHSELEKNGFTNPNTCQRLSVKEILKFSSEEKFKLNVITNQGIISDANAVYEAAKILGLDFYQTQSGLLNYQALGGRGSIYKDKHNNIYINDAYNASPESLLLSVRGVLDKFIDHEILIIIGEILENKPELIEKSVNEIQELCSDNPKSKLLDFRNISHELRLEQFLKELNLGIEADRSLEHISYKELEILRSEASLISSNTNLAPQEPYRIIYLKGSRGARLEDLLF